MTAKEDLQRIGHLDRLLKATEREISQMRSDIYTLSATDYSKERISGGIQLDISDKIVKLNMAMDRANKQWDELIDVRAEIRSRIDKVEDFLLRALLIERYVNLGAWREISKAFNYCEREMLRKHKEALQEYEKVNPETCHRMSF